MFSSLKYMYHSTSAFLYIFSSHGWSLLITSFMCMIIQSYSSIFLLFILFSPFCAFISFSPVDKMNSWRNGDKENQIIKKKENSNKHNFHHSDGSSSLTLYCTMSSIDTFVPHTFKAHLAHASASSNINGSQYWHTM